MSDVIRQMPDYNYGKIPASFSLEIEPSGYYTISGVNNAGKSTILQWLFSRIGNSIYIPSERGLVEGSMGSGTPRIQNLITQFRQVITANPMNTQLLLTGNQDQKNYIPSLTPALSRIGIKKSLNELDRYLADFNLGSTAETNNQDFLLIDGKEITTFGTGARSLITIMLALIHEEYQTILIDEPELFLEPRTQKRLKDLLIEKGKNKRIIVASHSHLFLDKSTTNYSNNFYISNDENEMVALKKIKTKSDLRDLTFRLLGASFDDLMLPENYLVVEGESDKIILEKILQLLNSEKSQQIQVVFSQGLGNAPATINAIAEMVRPFLAEESVYRDRIVCLLDCPKNINEEKAVQVISKIIDKDGINRLFVLGKDKNGSPNDLEHILPDSLYNDSGLDKSKVLENIATLSVKKDNHSELGKYKCEVAQRIADTLIEDHLKKDELSILVNAANQVLAFKNK